MELNTMIGFGILGAILLFLFLASKGIDSYKPTQDKES